MNWPDDRPEAYDADKWWDEESGEWVTTRTEGPGSRMEHLVAVSEEGGIYFGTV